MSQMEFTEEEALSAQSDEQTLGLNAQIQHLTNRNIFLRALVNRLQAELAEKESDPPKKQPQDRRRSTKSKVTPIKPEGETPND